MKYFFFLVLCCVQYASFGQYTVLFAEGVPHAKGAKIQQDQLENASFAIVIDDDGNLLEWSSQADNSPSVVSADILKLADVDTWISKWLNPYFGMSPSTIQYLKADSLAALLESTVMEMPMQSSSMVYSANVGLTWTPDESVSSWEVEFRNQYDETIGLETVQNNRIRLVLNDNEKVSVYVRNPRTKEGSGVFVLNGMSGAAKEKYAGGLGQIAEASSMVSVSHHILKAAFFESNGLYVDALSEYVLLVSAYPDSVFALNLLRWYIFRHLFRPWF